MKLLEESIEIDYDELMTEYDLPRRMKRLLKLAQRVSAWDPDELTPDRIAELNGKAHPSSLLIRRLFGKPARNITTKTFVIPVNDGKVTGYLFEKED